jgi:hypothetical protein
MSKPLSLLEQAALDYGDATEDQHSTGDPLSAGARLRIAAKLFRNNYRLAETREAIEKERTFTKVAQ